ncbi:MAG TPA: uracil-DNA glycosylase, partial [Stellaceae bacterium]|nr:uracil-DNA glycosylase [Stellaceae bacterium]
MRNLDRAAALALLAWSVEMGADEAIAETPRDRLAAPRAPAAEDRRADVAPARAAVVAPPQALAGSFAEAAQSARLIAARADTVEALGLAIAQFDGCALKRT